MSVPIRAWFIKWSIKAMCTDEAVTSYVHHASVCCNGDVVYGLTSLSSLLHESSVDRLVFFCRVRGQITVRELLTNGKTGLRRAAFFGHLIGLIAPE